MRTNTVLDDALIRRAMKAARVKTMRAAVDLALREFVARRRQRDILVLACEDLISPDYDVRAVRKTMDRGAG